MGGRQGPELVINPKQTPPEVTVRPVVGGKPEAVLTLEAFRDEYPVLKTAFMTAGELLDLTSPGYAVDMGFGPTFDEIIEVVIAYLETRVRAAETSDVRDVGIYYWRQQVLNILETAIRGAGMAGVQALPLLGTPDYLDTQNLRRFQWTGIIADGKKSHTNKVACHTDLERQFADFIDGAVDVKCYIKNERFAFSVTYYENNRPRQYYPDFIIKVQESSGREVFWIAETKGEVRPNTVLKRQAAQLWCEKMSTTAYGSWRYLFVQQRMFERAITAGVKTFAQLSSL